jgi:Helicase HerA, central domain
MARVAIESQAAPAAQGPIENRLQDFAVMLMAALGCVALLDPGVLLGAGVAGGWLWLYRPPTARRLVGALLLVMPLLVLHTFLVWGWPWREWIADLLPMQVSPVDGSLALHSLYIEALAGPLWFEGAVLAARLRSRRVDVQVRRDHRLDKQRWRAISGQRQLMFSTPNPQTLRSDSSPAHPPGRIRLGTDAETGGPLDLDLPADLAAHVFLPGASGSGKTTTVARLADGALANGYGVVIIDAKAGGLGQTACALAARYGVPFHLVDPDDADSLGYNPCTGDPASVANKLMGAFTYSPAAEIYKNIGMETVPVIVRGLQAANEPVTLQALYDAIGDRGMVNIAHKLPVEDRTHARLMELSASREGDGRRENTDRTTASGMTGLQRRLGALLEGKFGDLFRADNALDWDSALAQPSVTYIALSALASSEDVELMGRVIAQDLKQVCARRLRQLAGGAELPPILAVFDEFAALNEADQLADLLLQARQALMPTVISTQYLPETVPLRKACLGAGLLIVHRVEAEDAEAIAAQFGTRRASDVTHQVDYVTGFSEKGSIKRVDKFNVHPNELRNFQTGQVAVKSVPKQRYTIARTYYDEQLA